ncbi:hypothetical protein [Actinoplanes xinjiangensis]|jgi:hypothetical protein|uniref:Subtilisin inhibitor-like n=1 Tax=Actinoplanes xinjiangensis TaxID=512350 RepID=A0A316FBL9_9ACTN|nr:hypothetical protein [Actinoplanes xinjiangensis]PWK46281.1 hypothetical protein BC793_110275 [Actinoplanes xinjiangensis]GIF40782.1 hypothetical protein Axi01nite_50930 [Actinoplanes xinjiangensis]
MRARHVLGAIALSALAGCSSSAPADKAAPPAPEATLASPGAVRACSDVFVPDQPVTGFDEQKGCTDKAGTVQFIGAVECADGTKLWPVDAATGAPAGFGREGTAYRVVTGEVAADKTYKAAYEECVGDDDAGASPAPSAAK